MYIGIDIGGTHIRVASGALGKINQKYDFPTREFQASLQNIKEAVERLSTGEEIRRIGIGIPGILNTKTWNIYRAPNLVGWDKIDLLDAFSQILKNKIILGHDASVAALGETFYGAGKGMNPVLYYTVSTGVGSGLVVNGKIFNGIYNPEAGHQIISKFGPKHAGAGGSDIESLSSGSALQRLYHQPPVDTEGEKEWYEALDWLAIGITNSILHFSPQIVIIGGGMTKHHNMFFPPLQKSLKKYLVEHPIVPIVESGLGQDSGIVGALTLAEQG